MLGDDHGKSIPEPTRQRVREAARNLGYVPHGIARALREGSSRAPGTEVTVIWGRPGTPQREIRATVTALSFKPDRRRVDVTSL